MPDLPVESALPALKAALRERPRAVLVAPPGAGKTTRVPPALLREPWAGGGKLLLLAPRRLAARAAAARMAAEMNEPVGRTIGFRVRLESRVSAHTRIEVVTEGVFTRMIQADPALAGAAGVIFDEFHERSLEGDLGLALALDAQAGLREDLRLLVMSATLEAARISSLMDDAPVVTAEGRLYPIATRYLGGAPSDMEDRMAAAVRAALRAETGGVLCFLPGAREIERVARRLEESVRDPAVEIHRLYGALAPGRQDAAIAPAAPGKRKVVLSTAIAETSLTIEDVRVVIDSGLARRAKYDPATGLTHLETVRASQAAVEQRRGRAGRVAPGACWRLWDEGETRALIPFDPPEILEADLSGLALDLAAWGVRDPRALKWLDPPPAAAWREAVKTLRQIDALDETGVVTAHGRALAALPLSPRLAHMVAAAARQGRGRLAAWLAVLLGEQGLGGRDADLRERLRRFASDSGDRARRARAMADQIASAAGARESAIEEEAAGLVLALAFPERLAKARGARGEFVLANGRGAAISPDDGLAREAFLLVADLAGRAERGSIQSAAPIEARAVETAFADRIRTEDAISIDPATGAVRAQRTRMLGRIVLAATPLERPSGEAMRAAILDLVLSEGVAALPWREEERQWRARVAFLARVDRAETWPDVSDEALTASVETWLAPVLDGAGALADLGDGRLLRGLAGLLSFEQRRRLDAMAPARFVTPAGGSALIDYAAEGGPVVAVRLQEMFGAGAHPGVAGRPLKVTLLSPAGRPLQTTTDLPGFWRGSYASVRAEMRGRYPKHPWPEDPLSAPPTRRAKPRA
jgi:ATP-dependent helicase HrpB